MPAAGGTARRVTSHRGEELFPKFSPDGRTLAFTGQYGGTRQVFTIPIAGGVRTQGELARHAAGDRDSEDLHVPAVLAGEGEGAAVGRERGRAPSPRCEVTRRAARPPARVQTSPA